MWGEGRDLGNSEGKRQRLSIQEGRAMENLTGFIRRRQQWQVPTPPVLVILYRGDVEDALRGVVYAPKLGMVGLQCIRQ